MTDIERDDSHTPVAPAADAVAALSASRSIVVRVSGNHLMTQLLGARDEWLDAIEATFPDTRIIVRGNEINIEGDSGDTVGRLFEELVLMVQEGGKLDADVLRRTIDMVVVHERPSEVLATDVVRLARGGSVRPKTAGQRRYIDAIAQNIITFGLGPAGTGKSWLAVAMATQARQRKQVERIVLTRPAVEAGGRLGFRCTTRSTTWSVPRVRRSCSNVVRSKWLRWRSCGVAR